MVCLESWMTIIWSDIFLRNFLRNFNYFLYCCNFQDLNYWKEVSLANDTPRCSHTSLKNFSCKTWEQAVYYYNKRRNRITAFSVKGLQKWLIDVQETIFYRIFDYKEIVHWDLFGRSPANNFKKLLVMTRLGCKNMIFLFKHSEVDSHRMKPWWQNWSVVWEKSYLQHPAKSILLNILESGDHRISCSSKNIVRLFHYFWFLRNQNREKSW